MTHLLRLRPYEAYDAAVALAGLCAVGTRSLRCAALRHLVEVLLVLRHMGLGDLQNLLLLRWQELLKLRQLLYGLMGLNVDLVVFFRRDARVTTGEEVGDVFEVGRFNGVGVLRLTQVFVGVLDAKRLEQPFYRFVAVYLRQPDGEVEQLQRILALQLLRQRLHRTGLYVDLKPYAQ